MTISDLDLDPDLDHRVELHAGWTLWRWSWIRTPGFPARDILDLAAPDVAAAADELVHHDREVPELRASAIEQLWQLHHEAGPDARSARQAIEQLKLGKWPRDAAVLEPRSPALRALRAHDEARARQSADLERSYAGALAGTAATLRRAAGDEPFRAALLWQNRNALRAADWLRAHPEATNTRARQNQHLIASYLQRYCLKNDTIGFFGPIGWGEVGRHDSVAVQPGRSLLADRAVYFEHWAIDAVASAIAAAADVKPFLAPRLVPSVAVSGTTLHYGFDRTAKVPPVVARLLAACDGETVARELALVLIADASVEVDSEAEVYELLDELVERKLVLWTLEPSAVVHPERELRRLLERIDIPHVRERALASLGRLEAARDRVREAAGDVPRLERALAELDATFEEVTGQAATRRAGETYAARTVVYEDCVRDLSVSIGRPVLDRLGPVLTLVARSARWFTHEIATRYRAALHACYRSLAAASAGPVRYLRFWREIQPLLPEQRTAGMIPSELEDELARRWTDILALDMTQKRVDLTVADIAGRVNDAFDAPGPGWPGARHVSPDVLIAARSIDEIARGEGRIVLGEVHLGNTFLARLIIPHGPDDRDSLIRAYELDLEDARIMPVETRQRVTRADSISWSSRDLDLELGPSRSWRPRSHVLRAADLVVEPAGASLVIRDVASGRTFDVIAFLETYLAFMVTNYFKPAPRGPHVPRVTIDGVVLCREQWTFSPAELPSLDADARGAQVFATIRAWAHSIGLPRWVFVKVPEEPKPMFLDLASPIYVEMFAKLLRKATRVTVTEMQPTVEETWIPDAEGRLYTSELRMVAVDPAPWVGARTP